MEGTKRIAAVLLVLGSWMFYVSLAGFVHPAFNDHNLNHNYNEGGVSISVPVFYDRGLKLKHIEFKGVNIESPSRDAFKPTATEPSLVQVCPGVFADNTGISSASEPLQQCIDQLGNSGIISLPIGNYRLTIGLVVKAYNFTIQTLGFNVNSKACMFQQGYCAQLFADPNLYSDYGLLLVSADLFHLDHIVINGNRAARLGSQAAYDCLHTKGRTTGPNTFVWSRNALITNSMSINALCGSSFGVAVGDYSIIYGNAFMGNGDHWGGYVCDGLTLGPTVNVDIAYNLAQDNADVNLILFGGAGAQVRNNQIRMTGAITASNNLQQSFAGFMMDNMGQTGNGLGNFTGAYVANNNINCNVGGISGYYGCDFGMEIGPYAWYTTGGPIYGGTVISNTVVWGRQGINMAGAGTALLPVNLDSSNIVVNFQPSPGNYFTNGAPTGSRPGVGCWYNGAIGMLHETSAYNADPDTVENFAASQPPWTFIVWELCV